MACADSFFGRASDAADGDNPPIADGEVAAEGGLAGAGVNQAVAQNQIWRGIGPGGGANK